MNAVNIILHNQIFHYGVEPCAGFGKRGIVNSYGVIVLGQFLGDFGTECGECVRRAVAFGNAVRVYPCVKAYTPFVRFVNHELQNVISRFSSGYSGDILAPRLVGGVVKRIGHGTYLKKHHVYVVFHE